MKLRHIALVSMTLSTTGCATMNPYVQHNRDVSSANLTACSPSAASNFGLKYACEMSIRLEKARSEIISTRSGLTATIFPLTGIIGYNSARGINAPTNTAMTAGGFAGYSAVSTLAQPDRIRIYDNGLKSIQCAIGTYEVAAAQVPPDTMERTAVLFEARRLDALLGSTATSLTALPEARQEIEQLQTLVQAISLSATQHRSSQPQQAQLVRFVRNTVAKVNAQLTLSVPDNRQFVGDALGALQRPRGLPQQSPSGAKIAGTVRKSMVSRAGETGISESDIAALENAVSGLMERYRQFIDTEREASAPINFDECAYTDVADAGFKGAIVPLRIGPNDSYSGSTVDVAAGSSFQAVVSGGVPPYTATIAKTTGADAIVAKITTSDGLARLDIAVAKGTATGSHSVVVSDATNQQAKWLIVKVP